MAHGMLPGSSQAAVRANLIGLFHLFCFFRGRKFNSFDLDCSVPIDIGLDLFDLLV